MRKCAYCSWFRCDVVTWRTFCHEWLILERPRLLSDNQKYGYLWNMLTCYYSVLLLTRTSVLLFIYLLCNYNVFIFIWNVIYRYCYIYPGRCLAFSITLETDWNRVLLRGSRTQVDSSDEKGLLKCEFYDALTSKMDGAYYPSISHNEHYLNTKFL